MVNTPNNKQKSGKAHGVQLSAEYLAQQLTQLANQHNIKTWCLAYSGGVDSQVLLHLLHLTNLNIRAVYIDHGLQKQSLDWAAHCQQQCQQLDIPFQVINVNATAARGESPEAAARTARYNALKKLMQADSCLLTAQHCDDQAETILLQLLRGAGAAGLSGMAKISSFADGWHARPLLNVSQQHILDYAQQHKLSWVEDPSNQQLNFDRNYLRHSVIPNIVQRWPAVNQTLLKFSKQQAENSQLLDVLAEQDLTATQLEDDCLNIDELIKLDDARLRNVLRFWLKQNKSSIPSRSVLQQIVQQIMHSSHDSALLVSWAKSEVRRFRNKLYYLQQLQHDATQVFQCNAVDELLLQSIHKKLVFKKTKIDNNATSYVLNASIKLQSLSVRYRQGGERIKPAGRNGSHDLKSLFQEAAVPAWQRDRIPLLFKEDELIAVVGYWLADEFAVKGEGVLPELNKMPLVSG